MPKLRSPIWRIGGKGMLVNKLLPLLPPHKSYIEPFCGGASLLFAKQPCQLEVLNDIDKTLIQFFRLLRDPIKASRFRELLLLTPYSRIEYNDAYTWREEPDDFERLRKWFIINRQAFGGNYGSGWSHSTKVNDNRLHSRAVSSWLYAIDLLPEIIMRLREVQIECVDYYTCLISYDSLNAFFYLDPPYIPETRTQLSMYKHEMSADNHKVMVDKLLKLKGKVLLSGYQHPIYKPLEQEGWHRQDFSYAQGATMAKDGKAPRRIESVWFNYDL